MEETLEKVLKITEGPVLTGGIAAAGSYFAFPNSTSTYPVMGIDMPVYIISGATVAVGSYVGDQLHSYLLKNHPKGSKIEGLSKLEGMLINPILSGGGNAAVHYLAFGAPVQNLLAPFLIGAISELAANYIEKEYGNIDHYDEFD